MEKLYYIADIFIAFSIPIFFTVNYLRKQFTVEIWKLFWIGFLIGSTWEFAFYFVGPEFSDNPVLTRLHQFPIHPLFHPLCHTFWDAGLFMMGFWLVLNICKPLHFFRFSWRELGVMLVWGQIQELAVELSATAVGTWTFNPRWWNPLLFKFGYGEITLMPQLIWLFAPVVFYFFALRIYNSAENTRQ